MVKRKGKPKYEIYFKKPSSKRWFKNGKYYWNKKSANKDLKWLKKNALYIYKIKSFKGYWK